MKYILRRRELRAARRFHLPRPPAVQACWVNEQGDDTGHLHKHMISGNDYVLQKELSEICRGVGLGSVVDIRQVTHARGGVYYLLKYAAKSRKQKWGRSARVHQSSPGLKAVPTVEQVARREEWDVKLYSAHWSSSSPDSALDSRVMPRMLPDDDPRVLWVGTPRATAERSEGLKRVPLSNTRGGGAPDSGMPKRSDAVVPDGRDGATAGIVRRPLPPFPLSPLLNSFESEKKCVTTPAIEQEIAA